MCVCWGAGGNESVLAASSVNTLPGVFVLSGGNPLCSVPSSSPCSARFFASILFRFAGFQAVLSRISSTFMLSIQEVAHLDCLFARPSALPQLAEQLHAAAEELRLGSARFLKDPVISSGEIRGKLSFSLFSPHLCFYHPPRRRLKTLALVKASTHKTAP